MVSISAFGLVVFAAGFFVFSGRAAEVFAGRRAASLDFRAILAELDMRIAEGRFTDAASAARLSPLLDGAERAALSVESGLSVLKRRRALAVRFPEFGPDYAEAALRVSERFPHAESVTAMAVEALLSSGKNEAAAVHAVRLSELRFAPVSAAALGAAGDFSYPSKLPIRADELLLAAANAFAATDTAASLSLSVDAALVRALKGESRSALALLRERWADVDRPTGEAAALLAELEYDFGDARAAASLFSLGEDARSALRRADAASLSLDFTEAREAWKVVASTATEPALVGIALYDLAVTSSIEGDPDSERSSAEARTYLERLLTLDPGNVAGAIRLSRLLSGAEGDAVLASAGRARSDGLLDLERIRRAAEREGSDRTIAALWLLMNERPEDWRVARWAAYFMENYGETDEVALILRAAGRSGLDESWVDFHTALSAARDGRLDQAELGFARAANSSADWRLAANLAVLAEARFSMRTALERYEIAASLVSDKPSRSVLQLRVARCLEALGKAGEARRVLSYAIELDPNNRTARLELKRLGGF